MLKELLLSFLVQHVPPGGSWHSVEPMPGCGTDKLVPTCEIAPVCDEPTMLCRAPRWSDTHNAWVRSESYATAYERYELSTSILFEQASALLCLDEYGDKIEDCTPIRWGYSWKRKRNLGTLPELIGSATGSAIPESGFREDVQTGRGKSGKPVDEGEGRGKGGEVCFGQIIPGMAWVFADWITEEEREEARKSKAKREEIALQLVGAIDDPEPLRRCFRVQLQMLAHSRQFCDMQAARWYKDKNVGLPKNFRKGTYWWAMGMYSYYGVGPRGAGAGCYDFNKGKTLVRVRTLQRFLAKVPGTKEALARR
jgi:hypothetical protein